VFGYDDFDAKVLAATGGRGVDVVLDPVAVTSGPVPSRWWLRSAG
jgi:NADPH:quinone reductase-like Zn-dependent oxidoreductase